MGFFDDLFGDKTPPFFKLIKQGNVDGLKKYGAFDVNAMYDWYPPIMYALEYTEINLYSVVKFLIDSGCDVNARDEYTAVKYTPFIKMGWNHKPDLELTRLLAKHGANVNARSIAGASALSGVVFSKSVEFLDLLKELKADFNLRDFEGNTVLHKFVVYASKTNISTESTKIKACVERLIRYGTDLKAINKQGHTALDIPDYGLKDTIAMKKLISNYR